MTFKMFRDALFGSFPGGDAHVMDYLGATGPKLKASIPQAKGLTYEGFLQLVWQHPEMKSNPLKFPCFSQPHKGTTADGMPVYQYDTEWL